MGTAGWILTFVASEYYDKYYFSADKWKYLVYGRVDAGHLTRMHLINDTSKDIIAVLHGPGSQSPYLRVPARDSAPVGMIHSDVVLDQDFLPYYTLIVYDDKWNPMYWRILTYEQIRDMVVPTDVYQITFMDTAGPANVKGPTCRLRANL